MPNQNTSLVSPAIRCAGRVWCALPLAATALFLVIGAATEAQAPLKERLKDSPFKIAYECYVNGNWEIFVMNADGSKPVNLTGTPKEHEHYPQVSPDGQHIVFARCFPDQPCLVATVNINGGNLRQLTDNAQFDVEHPNWSPDSKKIVFEMQANTLDIATVNANGSGLTKLTLNPSQTFSRSPCYSPDGTRILFQQRPSTGSSHSNYGVDLFTMNPDGSGVTQVTRTATNERDPEWATAS